MIARILNGKMLDRTQLDADMLRPRIAARMRGSVLSKLVRRAPLRDGNIPVASFLRR